ncbi:unnamed protein product, partial [Mesorhabditis belari]|uniref:EF-hand domain-containing protein n=1 Tax=Mesorhabditis belari TaxID=2138241 RepID=A0AAF3FQQ9_9BILA
MLFQLLVVSCALFAQSLANDPPPNQPVQVESVDQIHHKFGDEHEMKDEAHIKQHFEDKINVETMTEEQRRFHYFSMHDLNKDGMIDGTEIMKSLTHSHDAVEEEKRGPGNPVADEDSMVKMIDGVLEQMDINGDGYIDFAEYMKVGN